MASVLIIDDEREIRDVLRSFLKDELGCYAVVQSNAEWGLKELQKRPYDIIFFDYQLLGQLSGLDFLNKVRSLKEKSFLVMISGFLSSLEDIRDRNDGVTPDMFLQKPFSLEVIKEIVEHVHEQKKAS